jgi:hypothetical protein
LVVPGTALGVAIAVNPFFIVGSWLLVLGYWLFVIGHWSLVIGYWLSNKQRTTNNQSYASGSIGIDLGIPDLTDFLASPQQAQWCPCKA